MLALKTDEGMNGARYSIEYALVADYAKKSGVDVLETFALLKMMSGVLGEK